MSKPLRILVGSPEPRSDGNPYLAELVREMSAECEVRFFSWADAFFWRYDLFHSHWPETLFRAGSRARSAFKAALAFALLARLTVCRVPVVQTVHNVRPHESANLVERIGLRWIARRTRGEVRMVEDGASQPRSESIIARTIPHGHYRRSYAAIDPLVAGSGRILFFGSIRPYKGVASLLRAFRGVNDPELRLEIAGEPAGDELAASLSALADGDPRVETHLRRLTSREMEEALERATLVVLPFEEFLNSGSALLSLSLGRPVLMPESPSATQLREECGPEWVHLYRGPLTPRDIEGAYGAVLAVLPLTAPTLLNREWDTIAQQHLRLFGAVVRG